LTYISASVIVSISTDGITSTDIPEADIMPSVNESIALTEAVYYILLSLFEPMHGYGIMQNVAALSDGRVNLAAGTLYGAISVLLERGWISAVPGEKNSRKKDYVITRQGKAAVQAELARLRELVRNGESIIGGDLE